MRALLFILMIFLAAPAQGQFERIVRIDANTTPTLVLDPLDGFGRSLAVIGDLDGNGVSEIAVGAPGDGAFINTGAVWILFMEADGSVLKTSKISAADILPDVKTGTGFGSALSEVGDFDGDGIEDLIVGSRNGITGGSFFSILGVGVLLLDAAGQLKDWVPIDSLSGVYSVTSLNINSSGIQDVVVGVRPPVLKRDSPPPSATQGVPSRRVRWRGIETYNL
jgi:hypothetical protein